LLYISGKQIGKTELNILHLHTGLNLTCGISKTIYLIAKYPVGNAKHFVAALDGNAGDKFSKSNIDVKFLNNSKNSLTGFLRTVKYIKKYIGEKEIDIIHSHHRYFDFVSYVISLTSKIKRVTSVQSIVYGRKYFSYKSPQLLTAGESVKKHLLSYFGIKENRIAVFNNFVDENEIPQNIDTNCIKKEMGIPVNAYVTGFVGRFSIKEKGIDLLIDAFNKFEEKHKDAYLIMIGGGEDIKKMNIDSEKIIVLDSVPDIFKYYKVFDCLVLPSRVDPFPLTMLEAGMMKVPFIGADVDGIGEAIKDREDGLLFQKNNTEMLLEKMELFYSDRELAGKCSDKLYEKIKNKYTCEKALMNLNNIYENL
jgi:glycosyltransferase involved in cell wall biosynthesis